MLLDSVESISLAILVDCSISEERTLPVEKEAASAFDRVSDLWTCVGDVVDALTLLLMR